MAVAQSIYGESTRIAPVEDLSSLHEPTRVVQLFMAGDIRLAKQAIRRWCDDNPCCVTVSPTTYIYHGGEEEGLVVGFRNYPRFPSDSYTLRSLAAGLGDTLLSALSQRSYMLVDAGGLTTWRTTRHA